MLSNVTLVVLPIDSLQSWFVQHCTVHSSQWFYSSALLSHWIVQGGFHTSPFSHFTIQQSVQFISSPFSRIPLFLLLYNTNGEIVATAGLPVYFPSKMISVIEFDRVFNNVLHTDWLYLSVWTSSMSPGDCFGSTLPFVCFSLSTYASKFFQPTFGFLHEVKHGFYSFSQPKQPLIWRHFTPLCYSSYLFSPATEPINLRSVGLSINSPFFPDWRRHTFGLVSKIIFPQICDSLRQLRSVRTGLPNCPRCWRCCCWCSLIDTD